MNTAMVRLNITIPKDLAKALGHLSGPGKQSQFITQAIRKQIGQQQKQALEKALEEGYRAVGPESIAFANEFEAVDLEGWDDY